MLIKRPADIRSSEITDEKLYHNRREFIRAAGIAAGAAAGAGVFWGAESTLSAAEPAPHGRKLEGVKPSELSVTGEKANSWEQITTYNNFYEFGTDKEDSGPLREDAAHRALVGGRRRRGGEARQVRARGHPQGADARRTDLPPPVRRGVVDGHPVGRLSARPI